MTRYITTSLLAFILLLSGCGDKPSAPASSEPTQAAAPAPQQDPNDLLGRWMRTDGNYAIEISSLMSEGKMIAKYFNPNPIKCDKTTYSSENDQLSVHIQLNDTNYPKCTYDLTYREDNKILLGKYFQAQTGQTYDVVFQKVQ